MRIELTRPNGHYPLKVARLPIPPPGHSTVGGLKIGAKNGTRTRDPDLGKVVLYQLSYFRIRVSEMRIELTRPNGHYPLKVARLPIPPPGHSTVGGLKIGAKNGTRTRDPDLGKVVLYQLSYFRILIEVEDCPTLLQSLFHCSLLERKTGLEPATPTLARSCSTN